MKIGNTILVFLLLFISACSKENNSSQTGLPVEYNLFFHILKSDGKIFEYGEVKGKSGYFNEEGIMVFNEIWYDLPISNDNSHLLGKTVFGPYFLGMSDDGYNREPDPGEMIEYKQLLLLKYEDSTQIDTLLSRNWSIYPEFRYFDIYKNDTLVQRFNDANNPVEPPWYITIQK